MAPSRPEANWPVLGAIGAGVLLVAAALGLGAFYLFFSDSGADRAPIAMVAVRSSGGSAIGYAYVGDGEAEPIPAAGEYTVYLTAADDRVRVITDVRADGDSPFTLPTRLAGDDAAVDPELSADIRSVIDAFTTVKLAEYTAYEAASGGYAEPLFTDAGGDPTDALDRLYAIYADAVPLEGPTLDALARLDAKAASAGAGPLYAGQPPLLPRAGIWDGIKDSFNAFFGYAGAAGERASAAILETFDEMTPDERDEAVSFLPPAITGGAGSYDDLASKLRNGELNNSAAQIRRQLWQDPGFAAAAQDLCDCNRPDLHTAHTEGAELASKGADLNVAVVKTVLGEVFPDISTGFDYADKANEWAEYAREVYKDPLAAAEGSLRGKLEEQIAGRIKDDLEACCGDDLDPDLLEQAAGALAKNAVEQVPTVFIPTPTPENTPRPTRTTAAPLTPTTPPTHAPTSVPTARPSVSTTVTETTTVTVTTTTTTTTPTVTPTSTPTKVPATATKPPPPTPTKLPTDTPVPTNTPVPVPTATPQPTATSTPLPVVQFSGSLFEPVTSGSVDSLASSVSLTADFAAGTLSGTISGGGAGDRTFTCTVNNQVVDTAVVTYTTSYSATFSGSFAPGGGGFGGTISVGGSVSGLLTTPFEHQACVAYNNQPIPGLGGWSGTGTISGVASPSSVSFSTSWTAGSATAGGTASLYP